MGGKRVNVGNSGLLPCRLSCCGLCVSPGDEVSMLELGTPGLLRCQLQLNEHHVVPYTQCQGERRAAGQEVTDLYVEKQQKIVSLKGSTLLYLIKAFFLQCQENRAS